MSDWPKCRWCGRFMNLTETHIVEMVYSGYPPEPDHEAYTCHKCMLKPDEESTDMTILEAYP